MIENNKKHVEVHYGLLDKSSFDSRALEVINSLQNRGYRAYIIGGAVRDLLLGKKPKDFDISTDAKPNEIYKIFSNSRIIGRRFRIVHVYFDRYIVEVSTFRRSKQTSNAWIKKPIKAFSQYIYKKKKNHENDYGHSMYEDSSRRDLTINAIYYDPKDGALYDFFHGIDDLLKHKRLRLIGDVQERFIEDPVRILRVLRFCAKLDFDISPELKKEIHDNTYLINSVNKSRLFEEFSKIFISLNAEKTFKLLQEFKIHEILFPSISKWIDDISSWQYTMIHTAIDSTVKRVKIGKPVMPIFLFAAFLWPVFQDSLLRTRKRNFRLSESIFNKIADVILDNQSYSISIMMRDRQKIKSIWRFQTLAHKLSKSEDLMTEFPFWRAGVNLYILRCKSEDSCAKDDVLSCMKEVYDKHSNY